MSIKDKVFSGIDGEEIAALAIQLADIYGPVGREEKVGETVFSWLSNNGFSVQKQMVAGTRFNVLGTVKGAGGGENLVFNSHMDTLPFFKGEAQTGIENMKSYRAWREGNKLFGLATLNDRGPMAAFLIAAKAIKNSGIILKGDLMLAAVVGEIGSAEIEEYQGPEFLGKGVGTKYSILNGPQVDYALVAETTNFGLSWVNSGVAYVKVTVSGQNIYTPRLRVESESCVIEHPNAIVKMNKVIEKITVWTQEYQKKYLKQSPCGIVRPKVNIGAIRGGLPYSPSQTAASCSIYLDIWLPPEMKLDEMLEELQYVLDSTGLNLRPEVYLYRRGHIGQGIEKLVRGVSQAYREICTNDPPDVSEDITSMWRDTNVYNEMGIPSLTFGPTRHQSPDFPNKYLTVEDLEMTARIYCKTAIEICEVKE